MNKTLVLLLAASVSLSAINSASAQQSDNLKHSDNSEQTTRVEVVTEQINIPLGQQSKDTANLPQRGLSRQQVLQSFGVPKFWQDDVGEPPITHWRYTDFSVYFENNRVIHSVAHSNATSTDTATSQAPEASIEQSSSSANTSVEIKTSQSISSMASEQDQQSGIKNNSTIETENLDNLDLGNIKSQP